MRRDQDDAQDDIRDCRYHNAADSLRVVAGPGQRITREILERSNRGQKGEPPDDVRDLGISVAEDVPGNGSGNIHADSDDQTVCNGWKEEPSRIWECRMEATLSESKELGVAGLQRGSNGQQCQHYDPVREP